MVDFTDVKTFMFQLSLAFTAYTRHSSMHLRLMRKLRIHISLNLLNKLRNKIFKMLGLNKLRNKIVKIPGFAEHLISFFHNEFNKFIYALA